MERNARYIEPIRKIVDYTKQNGVVVVGDKLKAQLIPEKYNTDTILVEYIKIFHKIRDSLAHGKYDLYPELGIISINNKKDDYEIKVDLPIELLEYFGYIDSSKKKKKSSVNSRNRLSRFLKNIFFQN